MRLAIFHFWNPRYHLAPIIHKLVVANPDLSSNQFNNISVIIITGRSKSRLWCKNPAIERSPAISNAAVWPESYYLPGVPIISASPARIVRLSENGAPMICRPATKSPD